MTAVELLADYEWIAAGLVRHGHAWLVRQYNEVEELDGSLRKVRDALLRSAPALSRDLDCLPDQLLGRLAEAADPTLAPLLEQLKVVQNRRPLQVVRSGLQRSSGSLHSVFAGHRRWISAVAFHSDDSLAITASWDGTAIVWDVASGTPLHTFNLGGGQKFGAEIREVAFAGDGTMITGGEYGEVIVWDLFTAAQLHTLTGHQSRIGPMTVTLDGRIAITGDCDGTVLVWNLESGARIHTLTAHWNPVDGFTGGKNRPSLEWNADVVSEAPIPSGTTRTRGSEDVPLDLSLMPPLSRAHGYGSPVHDVAVTGDGRQAITCGPDGTAAVWDLASGNRLRTLTSAGGTVRSIAVTPDGNHALIRDSRAVTVWDLRTWTLMHVLTGPNYEVRSMVVSPDGGRLVMGTGPGMVSVWDLKADAWLHTIADRDGSDVSRVAVNSNGARAVTAGGRKAVVWDLETAKPLHTLVGHHEGIHAVAITNDGTRVMTGSDDGMAMLWDLTTAQDSQPFLGHTGPVNAIAVTADGTRAVTGGRDGRAVVWNLTDGSPLHRLAGHDAPIRSVAITDDGSRAVTGGGDGIAAVWDLATGQLLHAIDGPRSGPWPVAVSKDGTRFFTGEAEWTVKVWDLSSGVLLDTLSGGWSYPNSGGHTGHITVTKNCSRIIAGASPGKLIVWDLPNRTQPFKLPHSFNGVKWLAVTSDGQRAITASANLPPVVWDLEAGVSLRVLPEYDSGEPVAISSDGTRVVVGDYGGARLYDLESELPARSLTGCRGPVAAVSISDDGAWIAVAGEDGSVLVWEWATGEQVAGWYGDVPMCQLTWADRAPVFVAADVLGAVHVLRFRRAVLR